jgi:acetyl-CoA synthetase
LLYKPKNALEGITMLEGIINRETFNSYDDFYENYQVTAPENFHFAYDVVDKWPQQQPNKRALVWCDDLGDARTFTFEDISRLSMNCAAYLSSLGISKGDRVLVILKRRWEYWVTAVALHRIGAVLIPASSQLTTKDIIYRAKAAEIRMIIAVNEPWVISQVESAMPDCPTIKTLCMVAGEREGWQPLSRMIEDYNALFPRPEGHSASDTLLIYFTSGTTGMPKMVVHDHSHPLGHIVTAKFWQRVENDGLHMTMSDSGWAKFGWGNIYGQWIAGSAILGYDQDKFDARRLIDVIRTAKPTTVCVPPTIYRFMMKEGLTREDFASVRHCATAGEPLSPEVSKEFTRLTGLTIGEGFGQSESSVLVGNYRWFDTRPGSMGKPSALYDIAILDENGEECGVGDEGEICVRNLDKVIPYGLLRGYWVEGKLTPCYDDVYHTGDIAWRDEDGYLWYVGRNDDVIKCSGYRIGPFEIETVLLTHPSVLECAITAAPDPLRGQVVKATIVLSQGYEASPTLTKEIQNYVKKMTAPYKYPRIVEYVAALPKTTSGKISRQQIRAAAEAREA